MKLDNIKQITKWRLCCGCGVCLYICPKSNIELKDIESDGIRPSIIQPDLCQDCNDCLQVCSGLSSPNHPFALCKKEEQRWGPILEIWEGCASSENLRWLGSSGGIATALSIFLLNSEQYTGVLHTAPDPNIPWKNIAQFSQNAEELLSSKGSRYSPSSPCMRLQDIESASNSSIFIGKGCDIQALRKAETLRPELKAKIGIAIGIFCAGTPSTQGTLDLLITHEIHPKDVREIRYRGQGWPGQFTVSFKDPSMPRLQLSYETAWGFLQKYRPYRCHLCPDGTAELADISCGDAWYKRGTENNKGLSLVVVRTRRGQKILRSAMNAGYLNLKKVSIKALELSQPNLLNKKRAIWGRLLAFKTLGIPAPTFPTYMLYQNWQELGQGEKLRSFFGTIKRIIQRRYYLPRKQPW